MIESFYDFDKSIEHKMDILEREGKTTCIIEYLDRLEILKKIRNLVFISMMNMK